MTVSVRRVNADGDYLDGVYLLTTAVVNYFGSGRREEITLTRIGGEDSGIFPESLIYGDLVGAEFQIHYEGQITLVEKLREGEDDGNRT
jgi:hypothetical protein